jgi:CRP-like cAMP-binding protein
VVQFYIHFQGVDDLLVGTMREPGALLGWSVFRQPYRYTVTTRCEEDCQVMRLPGETIMELVRTQPRLGYLLLKRVAATLANRLEQTRDILVRPAASGVMRKAAAS